ncbi:hypothetical protein [Corynebacterium sp.]|uniref:hypothetical protein n=1 Tax=Corynebacterium sp. TaxID=1720 RepID=UPI0026DD4578|nr:hypothetical protein [Corynebacterium sp.]MDO5031327.1 hypothetical protein [Corynebacterium sp.]
MNSKKIATVWVVVAIAIAAVVAVGWWGTTRTQQDADAVTVAEFVGGGVKQDPSLRSGQEGSSLGIDERVAQLAEALGIPVEAVPRGVITDDVTRMKSRGLLVQVLDKAIDEGKITPAEAQAVLHAFDAGLIKPSVDTIVAESNPALEQ